MNFLVKLGFKNIFRNTRRTILTISAVFFATFLIVVFKSYINGLFDNAIENAIMVETGDVKVCNKKYLEKEKLMPIEYYVNNAGKYIEQFENFENVELVTPRIKVPVMISRDNKNYNALVLGINPEKEKRFNTLHKDIVKGNYLSANSDNMIVGNKLAEELNMKIGDKITLLSKTVYNSISIESFKVSGIFSYGITGLDSKAMFVPIEATRELTKMVEGATELFVMLRDRNKELPVEKKINQSLPEEYIARSWKEQGNFYKMGKIANTIYNVIFFFFLILAAFVIINTIMISVYEREREIGALTALGMTKKEVLSLFIVEAGILSLIGSFLGSSCGGVIAFILSKVGINVYQLSGNMTSQFNMSDIIYLRPSIQIILFSFFFGSIVTIIFAVIPALRAVKVDPIKALRSI